MKPRLHPCFGAIALALAACSFDEQANAARGCDERCLPGACYLGYCLATRSDLPVSPPSTLPGAPPSITDPTTPPPPVAGSSPVGGSGPSTGTGGAMMTPDCVAGAPETCNGRDDDCDAAVDEEASVACWPDGTSGCATDAAGAITCQGTCAAGTRACNSGALQACAGFVGPTEESCGGAEAGDENCNGQVDDGCACTGDETQRCYTGPLFTAGRGRCRAGMQRCDNGAFSACEGEVTPAPESCLNLGADDDCDLRVDELDGVGEACVKDANKGECAFGVQKCLDGTLTCVTTEPQPTETACDGRDEDCDDRVDEIFDLTSDESHCGACNAPCAGGQLCCGGTCRNIASDREHCGGCGEACASGALCCGGGCVNPDTDPQHCGGCDPCNDGKPCCAGACVDTTNNNDHCGGCRIDCGESCTCQFSECRDPGGLLCL